MSLAHVLLRHATVSLVKNMAMSCKALTISKIDSLDALTRGANLASVHQFVDALGADARTV